MGGKRGNIERLLDEIDEYIGGSLKRDGKLDFYVIGGSAMVLHWGSVIRTKDLDVLYRVDETEFDDLGRRFGKDSEAHSRYGVWLHPVLVPYPPMPAGFESRSSPVEGPWKHIRVMKLDPHDLVISKLDRFTPGDRGDITSFCDMSPPMIDADTLRQTFERILVPREGMRENLERVLSYLDGDRSAL